MVKRKRFDLGMERDFNLVMKGNYFGKKVRHRGGKVEDKDETTRRYVFPGEIERAKQGYKRAMESGDRIQARQIAKIVQKKAQRYSSQQARIAAGETLAKEKIAALKEKRDEQQRNKQVRYLAEQQRYAKTRTGRLGGAMVKTIRTLQTKRGITKRLYQKQGLIPPTVSAHRSTPFFKGERQSSEEGTVQGNRTGRVGRPYGSFSLQYSQYGGVYGYRKAMSHQRSMERIQAQRDATITPEQQQLLRQQAMAQQESQMSPERRTIPDTSGKISLGSYNDEINNAANAVD